MYVTLFYGILESETGKLSYINAGHPPPAIFNKGSLRSRLTPTGPAIGMDTNGTFDIASVQLSVGDLFFAWTDGVTEVRDHEGELLGEKAVMQKLSQPLFSAQFTIDTVKEMISHHSNNGKKADDDVTMLAVRKLGARKRKNRVLE
jgi:serine phosphatase RsbU (regulator of sigma subunit)